MTTLPWDSRSQVHVYICTRAGPLRLVDDEDGAAAVGRDMIDPVRAEGFESAPTIVRGERHAEEILARCLGSTSRDNGRGEVDTHHARMFINLKA